MKKIAAILLAGIMCIGMSTSVFAAETTEPTTGTTTEGTESSETKTYSDMSTVTIKKIYKLENAGTTSPEETFTVEQIGKGTVSESDATSAPDLGEIVGAHFNQGAATVEGAEADITINLPKYDKVGIYEYTLREKMGATGGVTYRTEDIKLVVTVIEQGGKIRVAAVHTESADSKTKTGSIENKYSAAGGTNGGLQISKTVKGILGDTDKYFKVTVTLNNEGEKGYLNSYTVTGGSKIEDGSTDCSSSTITVGTAKDFWIKNGETLTIQNVPYGVTYTVDEADYSREGYSAEGEVTSPATVNSVNPTVSITNTKGGTVDTGVFMDKAPYIVIFGIVILGAAVVLTKKRFSSED